MLYLDRAAWGARTDLPRLGRIVPKEQRTEVHVHHTAAVDLDDTPNIWALDDAIRYMRKLQTVRPDLGLDVPYTECLALLETGGTALFEGRGIGRRGAHTAGHNTSGLGFSFLGNFDKPTDPDALSAGLLMLEDRLWELRHIMGFANLGSVPNPHGWEVWGHRDTAIKSCPGNNLYPLLASICFVAREAPMTVILGPPQVAQETAAIWLLGTALRSAYQPGTLAEIIAAYWKVGLEEGVRPEVGLAQACKETGYFSYLKPDGTPGDVKPSQWNFAGIGATGGGVPGESWPAIEPGVRGHLRRLRLYATNPPNPALHDVLVIKRPLPQSYWGSAPNVEDLGGKWAPSTSYGVSIVTGALASLLAAIPVVPPDVSPWAAEAWRKALARGILSSSSKPQATITDERLMVFFNRLGLLG